jgi:maltose/moltooligosaccharide transporter
MSMTKPFLTFWQIICMNFGFFGIQYSFGLQQSNMTPIYKYLGADEGSLPFLFLAGPMTGLIIQPIIGAMSDRTVTRWGRRSPYFLIGAIICSLSLLVMPYSPTLWFAASVLWILDAANNVAMEPYRAFISDKLDTKQHSLGFLTQSAFTGLAQTLAYLTPSLLFWFGMNKDAVNDHNIPIITMIAFFIGAFVSIVSILVTLKTTKELPLTADEIAHMQKKPLGIGQTFSDIIDAVREMPLAMRQLAIMKFFQWYGMLCYWIYIMPAVARIMFDTSDATSQGFRDAGLLTGQIGAFYNFIAFLAAFALVPYAKKFGAKPMHAICLTLAGIGMLCLPLIHDKWMLFIPMVGVGLAWASIMGNPYIMLAGSIPKERTGVYMGIFNMFIVIPMLIQSMTFGVIYNGLLEGKPENAIRFAGVFLICAAVAVMFVRTTSPKLETVTA